MLVGIIWSNARDSCVHWVYRSGKFMNANIQYTEPLNLIHGWRKKGIIHRGGGGYLRCPVFTSVHFSLRNEGSSVYIRVCEERERAWARILELFTPHINFAIFSQKNHQAKNNCIISLTPTIVDSILCTFSIPGIDFSPLYTPTEILPLENFVCLMCLVRHTFTDS